MHRSGGASPPDCLLFVGWLSCRLLLRCHRPLPPQQSLCMACWLYCSIWPCQCNDCCAGAAWGGLHVAPCHVNLFAKINMRWGLQPCRMATRRWQKRDALMMNKLHNKLSQLLLCTKRIDKSLFDCRGLHHIKVAMGRREHLPGEIVSPFGNNRARRKSGGITSNRLRVWPLTQVSSSRGLDVNLVCRGVCWSGTVQRWLPNGDA